ncbi:MAG: hypothetical protein RLP44_27225 [Aggregatilineales bacterium]
MQKRVLIILVLLLILPLPMQAQDNLWQNDGCSEVVIEEIAATTYVLDYHAACAHYLTCDPTSEGDAVCQFSTFEMLLEQCPLDDAQCHDGAILFAAAILAFDNPFYDSAGWEPPQTVIDGVPRGLEAFWNGPDEAALSAYALTRTSSYRYDQMMPLSRAVLNQRLGQTQPATFEFSSAFAVTPDQPLLLYARSQFYAQMGRMDEAAFDIASIASILADEPASAEFVATLQEAFPLDETVMGAWMLYPLAVTRSLDDGYFTTDQSLEPPRPIQLGVFEDIQQIAAIGLKNWSSGTEGYLIPDDRFQVLGASDEGTSYILNYVQLYENSGSLTLTFDEGNFIGHEVRVASDVYEWNFIVAPANAPDPRLSFADARICEGGVVSRVGIGTIVTGASFTAPLTLADSPAGATTGEVYPRESDIAINDAPVCVENVLWWHGVQAQGESGWFAENDGMTYHVAPVTGAYCALNPPTLATRLSVGTTGAVVPDLGANNMRAYPSSQGELLDAIPPQATFDILGGPVCIDDLVWWFVDYDGLLGWTAEGADGIYWLAPTE